MGGNPEKLCNLSSVKYLLGLPTGSDGKESVSHFWDENPAFSLLFSVYMHFDCTNYIVFIFPLAQGQHLSRTSTFNILSTNSSEFIH